MSNSQVNRRTRNTRNVRNPGRGRVGYGAPQRAPVAPQGAEQVARPAQQKRRTEKSAFSKPPGFPANWESILVRDGLILVTLHDGFSPSFYLTPSVPTTEGNPFQAGLIQLPRGTITAAAWLRSRNRENEALQLQQKIASVETRLLRMNYNGDLTALGNSASLQEVETFINSLGGEYRRVVRLKADDYRQYLRRPSGDADTTAEGGLQAIQEEGDESNAEGDA